MAIINQHPAFSNLGAKPKEIVVTDSSFLSAFKYDTQSMLLTVVFKNGAEYIHQMVYPSTVESLETAQNKNEFYLKEIKGKSPSSKIIDKTVGPRGGSHGNRSQSTGAKRRGKSNRQSIGRDSSGGAPI